MTTHLCPHCGNADRTTLQDNGHPPGSHDLTMLCVAPCDPADSTLDPEYLDDLPPEDVVCGLQWSPNCWSET